MQLSVLATLDKHGPLRSGELAAREAVTAPTMTRVLSSLAERGLINREPDPTDARSVRVSLSPAGLQALARIRSERTALLGARVARLTAEQRASLVAALPALEALIEED
nr:MarR family transcriptional regulator [Planosporangium thailandense]